MRSSISSEGGMEPGEWRGYARCGLLSPLDPAAPDALDAHPLVREWFGERLRQTNEDGMEGRPWSALRASARHDQGRRKRQRSKVSRRSIKPYLTVAALNDTKRRSKEFTRTGFADGTHVMSLNIIRRI